MHRFVTQIFLIVVVVATTLAGLSAAPSSVQALVVQPPGGGGSSGGSCMLPDGSKGFLQSDNRTCCPIAPSGGKDADPTACLFAKYINPAIQLISAAIGVAIVIAIILGAMEYITSEGEPQKAAAGKKRITEALIGLAAFILLYAFLQFIIPGGFANGG